MTQNNQHCPHGRESGQMCPHCLGINQQPSGWREDFTEGGLFDRNCGDEELIEYIGNLLSHQKSTILEEIEKWACIYSTPYGKEKLIEDLLAKIKELKGRI